MDKGSNRAVGVAVWIAAVALLTGCSGLRTSSVGEESKEGTIKLPEVVVEERVEEDTVIASSDPPEPPPRPIELPQEEPAPEPFIEPEPPIASVTELEEAAPLPFLLEIPFNFDQSGLRDDALTYLEVNAARLMDEEVGKVLLEGRGDEVGTSDYNILLGERRARAVKRYLLSLGLTASSVLTTSYGKERPLCYEHNVECWQRNRSVRFVIQ